MFRVIPGPQARDVRPPRHRLPDRLYAALWTFTVLLHAVSAAFLLACAKLYWVMENGNLDYFVSLLASERDRHFRVVGTGLGLLGALHALQLLSHVGASVLNRKLTVRTVKFGPDSLSVAAIFVNGLVCILNLAGWGRQLKIAISGKKLHRNTANDNESYGRIFAIRKTVEIATQVPNAYLYSTLVARPWINHVKVALVVANCWSALIIHRMLMKNEVSPSIPVNSSHSVRFLAVVVDALLATATGVLLPSVIFLPYLQQFDFENMDFPESLLYGDTAFPNLVLENRAFFAISWVNAVMKAVPHISVFLSLVAIASMLDEPKAQVKSNSPRIKPIAQSSSFVAASYRALVRASNSVQSSRLRIQRINRLLAPIIFLVTGGIVLALHLTAQYSQVKGDMDVMTRACMQRMHPWLAPNFSCAVVKYNCYQEEVSTPSPDALSWLEREAVRSVIFLHCSEFVMPTVIREFPSLMGIELWNVTLVRWGEEAALSASLHPMMLFMIFAFVNLTNLPMGILQSPLPPQLTDLEFCHTNLTTLPEEIAEAWSSVGLVYIEHSRLDPFPAVLLKLPYLSELSLIDNNIESIPDDALVTVSSPYFYDLAFSRNPLEKLPDARSKDFDVSYLSLECTQVTELPTWIETQVWDSVSLGGSPICDDNVNVPEIAICDEDADPLGEERFPSQLIAPQRKLDA